MTIIEYIAAKSDLSGWLTAGSTVVLAVITGFYAWQTKRTVDLMKKQMDGKRKEDERYEAVSINEEIAKGIFILKNIIQDVNFKNINESMKNLGIVLFNKYGYVIEEEKRLRMFEYFNLLHVRSRGNEFSKEEKEKFDKIGQELLQYYWEMYKKFKDRCMKSSIVSKEIMEECTKVLENEKT